MDMSADFGCHPSKLKSMFSARELANYLVHYMRKAGYTFIREDIEKHRRLERQQRHQAFLLQARQHWNREN